MVLCQDGSDLYGQAKYEPDRGQAWNAVVIGSVKGRIYLVLTALKDTVQFSSRLKGTYDAASGSIKGDILQVSNGMFFAIGLEAMWIDPDISSYTSAREEPRAKAFAIGEKDANATLQTGKESLLHVGLNRFVWDVRNQAGVAMPPAVYQARLKVGETTLTQPFKVLIDRTRVAEDGVTAADLREQYAHNMRMRDLVASVNQVVMRIHDAQGKLKGATSAQGEGR